MEKFNGKYRIESTRLKNWDYSGNGFYFITIVTYKNRSHFGDIIDGKMILNDFGKIASEEWYKSFEIRKELELKSFVLMPNHLHAVIGINSTKHLYSPENLKPDKDIPYTEKQRKLAIESHPFANQPNGIATRRPKSISSFVAGYKSSVVNKIDDLIDEQNLPIKKFNRKNPLWHTNYHDHIIRDRESFERITKYIKQNPEKWSKKYT